MHSALQHEDSIHIKVPAHAQPSAGAAAATEPKPIIVDRTLLAAYSSCARGLPADATEWDVSQLVLLGQPVKRETVVKWLNAAYKPIHGDVYEHQHNNPASSMSGLAQLLAFADAVGSSRGLLLAFDTDAMELTADVQHISRRGPNSTAPDGPGAFVCRRQAWGGEPYGFHPINGRDDGHHQRW